MKRTTASALVLVLALGACAQRSSPLSVTDRDTIAACQDHADQVYDRLNRGAIYSVGDNGAPYSGTGLVGNPTAGLSDRYARDRMVERCVRVAPSGAAVAPSVPPPPASPTSPAR